MLSKEASRTIFCVFGMTRPGIEPRSPEPLANILTARPMSGSFIIKTSTKICDRTWYFKPEILQYFGVGNLWKNRQQLTTWVFFGGFKGKFASYFLHIFFWDEILPLWKGYNRYKNLKSFPLLKKYHFLLFNIMILSIYLSSNTNQFRNIRDGQWNLL